MTLLLTICKKLICDVKFINVISKVIISEVFTDIVIQSFKKITAVKSFIV